MNHPTAANLMSLDYADEAKKFRVFPERIIDAHCHVNGARAAEVLLKVCDLYQVECVYSMSRPSDMEAVRKVMGERVQFIGIANYWASDLARSVTTDYQALLKSWAPKGMKIAKFWTPPRAIELGRDAGDANLLKLNSPRLRDTIQCAIDLGMIIMVHVGDPDTWFATRYKDSSVYGTKADHYKIFEEFLSWVPVPVIAAHMGGSPENFSFLDRLLTTYPKLYIDTSATRWVVREVSKHPEQEVLAFFDKWQRRLLFGSDIVAFDAHLAPGGDGSKAGDANSPEEAFDLYASRYWALRTMLETSYDGPSPIADPDLPMVDPNTYNDMSSPRLVGRSLPPSLLERLYFRNIKDLLQL